MQLEAGLPLTTSIDAIAKHKASPQLPAAIFWCAWVTPIHPTTVGGRENYKYRTVLFNKVKRENSRIKG